VSGRKRVQQAHVRTNSVKDSICSVKEQAVRFEQLWSNYVTGNPYKPNGLESDNYDNQCAIRISATLHKLGIEMRSFSQKSVKPMAGRETLGRILLDGKPAATRAQELAEWLKLQPFCGLPREPEDITGQHWEEKIKGRTGIIMFHAYWLRSGETVPSGGHIDLWNGSRLTYNGVTGTVETFARFRLGIHRPWLPLYSDLRSARLILFFFIP